MLKRKTRDCEENEVEKESGKSTVSKCSDLSLFLLLPVPHSLVFATPLCCALFPQKRYVYSSRRS